MVVSIQILTFEKIVVAPKYAFKNWLLLGVPGIGIGDPHFWMIQNGWVCKLIRFFESFNIPPSKKGHQKNLPVFFWVANHVFSAYGCEFCVDFGCHVCF